MTSPRKTTSGSLKISSVLLPKRSHTLEECEDAFACNLSTNRFAVADGATEAFDSGTWARRLANRWVNASGLLSAADFWQWLESEGQAQNKSWENLDLPWYSLEKRRSGSFAAFVGFEIDEYTWRGLALGDSCLVQITRGVIHTVFPLSTSDAFGSAPVLAPSCIAPNSHAQSTIAIKSGELRAGDRVLLLTDATAAWYLKLNEQQDHETCSMFQQLLSERNDLAVTDFLEQERARGRLKDDDVAIVCIEV